MFVDVPQKPVPSLLRGFSAPVILNYRLHRAELAHLMAHDADAFNRWEAGQRLAHGSCCAASRRLRRRGAGSTCPRAFVDAFARVLADAPARIRPSPPKRWRCPPRPTSPSRWTVVDPDAIHAARTGAAPRISPRLCAETCSTPTAR